MIQKNTHFLLRSKIFKILLFAFSLVILVVGIKSYQDRYKLVHSPVYTMLQGDFKIIGDLTYVERSYDATPPEFLGFLIQIHNDRIRLPEQKSCHKANMPVYRYSWKVVSSNPDSILIDAYPHALHGKYKVTFKSYKSGTLGYTIDNYVYLDNDSTHLCLKKIK